MRDILEGLPHALFSDPKRESDDPGIARDEDDDDLVRPLAEEDLTIPLGSKRSPLARHVELVVDAFDPRMPLPVGLTLFVEGQRVHQASFLIGTTHQGIERRAAGLSVLNSAVQDLLSLIEPGVIAQLAYAEAIEKLAAHALPVVVARWRSVVTALSSIEDHATVLAHTVRRTRRGGRPFFLVASAARAAATGLDHAALVQPLASSFAVGDDERATLLRRIDDITRAIDAIDIDRVTEALQPLLGSAPLSALRCRELGIDGPAKDADGCTVARCEARWSLLCAAHGTLRAAIAHAADDTVDSVDVDTEQVPKELTGMTQAQVYGPTGTLSCFVSVSAGRIQRLRLRPPDLPMLLGVTHALRGVRLDDVSEALASFGLHASALDR